MAGPWKKSRASVQQPDDSRGRTLRQCVAATMLHRVELHAAEQHRELRGVEPQLLRLRIVTRNFVTAEFQAFAKQGQPIPVPPQNLQAVATAIEKQEQVPVK